jgi:hypothetical protein
VRVTLLRSNLNCELQIHTHAPTAVTGAAAAAFPSFSSVSSSSSHSSSSASLPSFSSSFFAATTPAKNQELLVEVQHHTETGLGGNAADMLSFFAALQSGHADEFLGEEVDLRLAMDLQREEERIEQELVQREAADEAMARKLASASRRSLEQEEDDAALALTMQEVNSSAKPNMSPIHSLFHSSYSYVFSLSLSLSLSSLSFFLCVCVFVCACVSE